jgi:hypothetical protein
MCLQNFTTGSICVTAANACGNSASKCLSLTNKPPTPASITGPSSVCPNQAGVAFSTPLVSPYTYTWTVPSSVSIASGQGTDIVSVNWGTVCRHYFCEGQQRLWIFFQQIKINNLAACFEGEPDNGNFAFDNERSLSIYPNPNDGNFTISAKFAGSFDLLNELGQLIETFQLSEDIITGKKLQDSNRYLFRSRERRKCNCEPKNSCHSLILTFHSFERFIEIITKLKTSDN